MKHNKTFQSGAGALAVLVVLACGTGSEDENRISSDEYYPQHHAVISQDSSRVALLATTSSEDEALVVMDMNLKVQGEHLRGRIFPIAAMRWGKEPNTIYIASQNERAKTSEFLLYHTQTREITDLTARAVELGLLDDLVHDFDISPTTGDILVRRLHNEEDRITNLEIYTSRLETLQVARPLVEQSFFHSVLRYDPSGAKVLFTSTPSTLSGVEDAYYVIDSALTGAPRLVWKNDLIDLLVPGADWINSSTILVPRSTGIAESVLVRVDVNSGKETKEEVRFEDSTSLDVSPNGKWLLQDDGGFSLFEL